jgi:hypothetical protein
VFTHRISGKADKESKFAATRPPGQGRSSSITSVAILKLEIFGRFLIIFPGSQKAAAFSLIL